MEDSAIGNLFMNKKSVFNKIARDIKSVKIQGARNIAKKALYAYNLIPTKDSKKKLDIHSGKYFN